MNCSGAERILVNKACVGEINELHGRDLADTGRRARVHFWCTKALQ